MTTIRLLFAAGFLASMSLGQCLAQPRGPATLENLLNANVAPVAEGQPAVEGASRPAGVVVRPADGIQHPDIDKAWAEYDAVILKVGEEIRAAISKQFDAATAKGNLDAAEKWQAVLEKFEKGGEIPSETETKAAVNAAVADYKKAKEELAAAYESVVKALTIEKKIVEAKAAREELHSLSKTSSVPADRRTPQSAVGASATPLRRGNKIADFICTVTDDFVIDIYVNGELVPADKRKLTGERFGAQMEQIDVPIHKGDWVVFAVANNRLRWGGSYYFGAAGMTQEKRLVFQSKLGDPRWTYTDDPGAVTQLIRQRNTRGRPVESVKVVWGDGHGLMKERTNNLWTGDPVWGAARLSWIKFIVD
jgi:hypothetical protein